ncbi:hypothetical protein [Tropicimonas sp. IMCC6043]|uniref:hypothetical protein n=1 Tax=Tropicimonas sp. IMCC6043 TaxID=2510645 RepID=UPI00101D72DF|nr:hypothetical protein [Tropicimonas sp. IMCC6043]RYH12233.1 hypothetical protein EU800_01330 [Tropicimonas sp. IMCC6043]
MRLALLFLGLALALVSPASADGTWAGLGPSVPKATGEPHPEGNAYMRRHHMQLMRHDRNLTVHDGDRDVGASLSECFECHAVEDGAGGYVTYESEQHFCRACHDFAAVKVDCFMCHRSTPEGFEEPPMHAFDATPEQDIQVTRSFLDHAFGPGKSDGGRTE